MVYSLLNSTGSNIPSNQAYLNIDQISYENYINKTGNSGKT